MYKIVALAVIVIGVSQSASSANWNWGRRVRDGQAPSLLPSPNGPFYGFPFPTKTTMSRFLPFSVAGTCEAGKVYTITKPEDFVSLNYSGELECIFNAARAPSKVPEGALYGNIISAVNSQVFNQALGVLWKGNMINKTECNGNTTYIGWNNFGSRPTAPFIASIKPLGLNLAPAEYDDGRNSLIIDYSQEVTQMCPEYRAFLKRNFASAVFRAVSLSGAFDQLKQFVNAVRFVGKQADGSSLYIGKIYLKDMYRDDHQAVTVGFFSIVNFDNDVNPLFISGTPMLPLLSGFKYMFPGIVDLMFRINPIDNLITTPIRTIGKMVRGALRIGRDSLLLGRDLPFGYGSITQSNRNFQHRFYSDAVNARQNVQNVQRRN